MCRMIAFVGGRDADLGGIYAAFRQGSQCDPYATAAFASKPTCHPNGWGYAIYDGLQLHHFRSSRPAWEEEVPLPRVQGPGVFALFHSRMASNPALSSPICSHPFMASNEREILLLAHNGGVETEAATPKDIVDSEWALGVIAERGLAQALPLLRERTKPNSALNLIVLTIPRDQSRPPEMHCLNFFKAIDSSRVEYYRMFRARLGGGELFFSSTFKDLGIKGLTNIEAAPFDQLFSLRLPAGLWNLGQGRESAQRIET